MDHAVKLTINGETREFPMGITYKEVVKAYEKTSPAPVILVIAGGKICELHKKAERDGEVRLVTTKDSIGNKTYKRTACLVLLKAIYDLAGKEKVDKVVLHYSRIDESTRSGRICAWEPENRSWIRHFLTR